MKLSTLIHKKRELFLLAFILLIAFIIRVNHLDYPMDGERIQFYLVGKHIAQYHEFPLAGNLSVFGIVRQSPVHFYLSALLPLIGAGITTTGIATIALQLIGIVFLYLLAKGIFSTPTALLTVILLTFSYVSISDAQFLLDSSTMQVFVIISYYLLFLSYKNTKFPFLLFSIVMFLLGAGMYMPALIVAPVFGAAVLTVIKKRFSFRPAALTATMVTVLTFLSYYTPTLYFYRVHGVGTQQLGTAIGNTLTFLPSRVIAAFIQNLSAITFLLFQGADRFKDPIAVATLAGSIVCLLVYVLHLRKQPNHFVPYIIAAIFLPLAATSFLVGGNRVMFYFVPVLGLTVMVLAESIYRTSQKLPHPYVVLGLSTVFCVMTFLGNPSVLFFRSNFRHYRAVDDVTSYLVTQIITRKNTHPYQNYGFFTLAVYREESEDPPLEDTVLWTNLEEKLKEKLITVDDTAPLLIRYPSADTSVLVICNHLQGQSTYIEDLYAEYGQEFSPDNTYCMKQFSQQYPSHHITDSGYSRFPFVVFTAEKNRTL